MATKVRLRLCLLAFSLLLSSVSVAFGEEREDAGGFELDECFTLCDGLKGDVDEYAACEKYCELNQRGREHRRVSPRREFELCQRRCQSEQRGREQQWRCQQRCQEQLRKREQHGEGDKGRPDHQGDAELEQNQEEESRGRERESEHERSNENPRDPKREGEERRREQERQREREHGRGRGREENPRDPKREREEQRREQERREREREREHRRGRNPEENPRDPERELEERVREQERREREREREREHRRGRDPDENPRDPERESEERRREQERREREREREREHGRGRGPDENPRDPEREREERRRERELEREREHGRGRGPDENPRDPERQREERRREQERREREREREREHGRGRGPHENPRDPEREREERRREQERREREREREREHGRGRGPDENPRDPEREGEERRREQERREREREREREHGRGRGPDENPRDPEREREEWRREQERRERERERGSGSRGRENEPIELRQKEEEGYNPYYFQEHRFQSRFRSDEGHIRVLEKFSDGSELLRGIKNHRLSILEARPQTFIIPYHLDGESVLVVVRGRATITLVWQEKRESRRESYNLERGDVMTVPTGTTVYVINHGNENLQIVKLVQSVNNPGEFKEYLLAGGEGYGIYSTFSYNVLEAALNVPRERIFRQRGERRGVIVRAPPEHLRALSQRTTSTRKGGGRGTRGPIKLESQSPIYNNKFGQMFEVCPDEFPQLRDTDVAVAIVDIKRGGMMVPHYSSRATWVVFVSEGIGSFEMACPHIQGGEWQRGRRGEERHRRREEEEEREGRSGQLERVTGQLAPGGVLVIPAGHPIAVMASQNENLRLVAFGINAENNHRNFLAGRENIMNEIEQEAKELAFNIEGKEVEQIFRSQRESFFTEGPERGRRRSTERERSHPLLSILKFAGYL